MKSVFLETDEELFDIIANVDRKGAYSCMRRAASVMVEKGTASVSLNCCHECRASCNLGSFVL